MNADWFLYKDFKRKPFAKQNWIPLRAIDQNIKSGHFGSIDYRRDTFACGSLAVPLDHRDLGEKLGWSQIGLIHETRHYVGEDFYKPVDTYLLDWNNSEPTGIELVIVQGFGSEHLPVWHINQDLVVSLNLLREGDTWVRPDEGYIDVIRLHRDEDGSPSRVEIRTEFLRDYLKARRMALRIAWYRDRDAILESVDQIEWSKNPPSEQSDNFRFETRCDEIHEGSGMFFGGQTAVLSLSRTDADPDDDVPEFGPESDQNTTSQSRSFGDQGRKVYRVEGEIWAEEWVEPAAYSWRVGDETPPSGASYIVDASGTRLSADDLNSEDVGRYLWFRPEIVNDILSRRGACLSWHTKQTGSITLTFGYAVHFGLNRIGLLNAYAYDVAKLPEWQRLIWQGYNIAPDGGVSQELLAAQMEARPARTHPPEKHFSRALRDVNHLFNDKFGSFLFREHGEKGKIIANVHRFRALQIDGIFDLAKDINRLITEDIDTKALIRLSPPKDNAGKGSLKSLERLIGSKLTSEEEARSLMSIMHAIYALRGSTSHLPSLQEREEALNALGVSQDDPYVEQGRKLLDMTMHFLANLARLLAPPR